MPPASSDSSLSERSTGRDSLDKIGHVFLRELRLPPRPAYKSLRAPSGPRFSRSSSSASACLQQLVRAPASVPASVSGSDDDRATPAPIQCPRPGEDYPCTLCPTLLVDACKRWLLSLVQWAEFHRLSSREWKKTLCLDAFLVAK